MYGTRAILFLSFLFFVSPAYAENRPVGYKPMEFVTNNYTLTYFCGTRVCTPAGRPTSLSYYLPLACAPKDQYLAAVEKLQDSTYPLPSGVTGVRYINRSVPCTPTAGVASTVALVCPESHHGFSLSSILGEPLCQHDSAYSSFTGPVKVNIGFHGACGDGNTQLNQFVWPAELTSSAYEFYTFYQTKTCTIGAPLPKTGNNAFAFGNEDGFDFGSTEPLGQPGSVGTNPQVWCGEGASVHRADFNHDGNLDLLCHVDATGANYIAYGKSDATFNFAANGTLGTPGSSGRIPTDWCGSGATFHVEDINGDDSPDLLCHFTTSGDNYIAYGTAQGTFNLATNGTLGTPGSSGFAGKWCGSGAFFRLADLNGDDRSDLYCHSSSGGNWVAYASEAGTFRFTANGTLGSPGSSGSLGPWCGTGATVHLADFNADDRFDILCRVAATGDMWVAYGTEEGAFRLVNNGIPGDPGSTAKLPAKWCGGNLSLYVADFNGDARSDLLCHQTGTGSVWVAYAHMGGYFNLAWIHPWGHPGTVQIPSQTFCAQGKLYAANLNGDPTTDLFCHDAYGKNTVAYLSRWTGLDLSGVGTPGIEGYSGELPGRWWCGSNLYIDDFNGDRKADLYCRY